MVYLEHSASKFWRCVVDAGNVTISYGKCGTAGRSMTKEFNSEDAAMKYFAKQEASKRKGGYSDSEDPTDSTTQNTQKATPQKRAASTGAQVVTPSKKAGLGGFAAPKSSNVVDSGVAGLDSALASRVQVHDTYHARLALVDASVNSDKYYILQMLIDENPPKKTKGAKKTNVGAQHYLFTRWGRTGTGGQAKIEGPFDGEDSTKAAFEKVFKSKTAVEWKKAVPGSEPKQGKYEYLAAVDPNGDDAYWYYYLKNDPLGKKDGWYQYDERNSIEVEELHGDWLGSKKAHRLATRIVTSESSGFQYRVDLKLMQQTNTSSGTVRPIARTDTGKPPNTRAPGASSLKNVVTPTKPRTLFADSSDSEEDEAPPKKKTNNRVLFDDDDEEEAFASSKGVVDKMASSNLKSGSIFQDYNVMLNQTNLGANNNKFYKIQLIETLAGSYYLFTRWGRVGEDGKTQEQGPFGDIDATKEFAKKFKSKSANKWEDYQKDKDSFVSKKGKYTVLEMEEDDAAVLAMAVASTNPVAKSELDPHTKELVDLIFNEDMFKAAMTKMQLDPKKLPLGALSQAQIAKGYTVLEQLEDAITNHASQARLEEITSEFYTLIPHAFGRSRGPVLDSAQKVNEKYDMLNTLADIEAAQSMQKHTKNENDKEEMQPHPSDLNYEQLAAKLTLLNPKVDKDFKLIQAYFDDTKGGGMTLQKVWSVDRLNEDKRFAKHASIKQRKLLWHGTNVAVVAAILKSGLRIMPHSGGRVGRGIYLADQHEKSAWYTQSANGTTIMFLVEGAMGEMHEIQQDDPSLTVAPKGYDSVLAKGRTAPPKEKHLYIDGNPVAVPQGKARTVSDASGSYFDHNEFLLYQESQHRIRYIISFDSN